MYWQNNNSPRFLPEMKLCRLHHFARSATATDYVDFFSLFLINPKKNNTSSTLHYIYRKTSQNQAPFLHKIHFNFIHSITQKKHCTVILIINYLWRGKGNNWRADVCLVAEIHGDARHDTVVAGCDECWKSVGASFYKRWSYFEQRRCVFDRTLRLPICCWMLILW